MEDKKPNTAQKFFLIVPSPHRSFMTGDDENLDSKVIACWQEARSLLKERVVEVNGDKILIEINWSPLVRRQREDALLSKRFFEAFALGRSEVEKIINEYEPRRPVRVATRASGSLGQSPLFSAVESIMYDVFLVMNIAVPGSANFYNAMLRGDDERNRPKISLSSHWFELAFLIGEKFGWPIIRTVELKSAKRWYLSIRNGCSQVPSNRMEKVAFALLHIVSMDRVSPTAIIWVFYALETLFDTKVGENFRVLVERINLLLSPNEKQLKRLRKNLRELYDLRSSFVHGGLQVAHPMHDETLDSSIDAQWRKLSDLTEFGFALLIASLQEIVANDWREPSFKEVLHGDSLNV